MKKLAAFSLLAVLAALGPNVGAFGQTVIK
jgi:hypothetical protein